MTQASFFYTPLYYIIDVMTSRESIHGDTNEINIPCVVGIVL